MSLFHPESFQGSLSKKPYFEGWYCKQVSADRSSVYAVIPGISLSKEDSHAFIQVINGITAETWHCSFPLASFSANRRTFDVTIGNNHFSRAGMQLNIDQEGIKIQGALSWINPLPFPASLFAPGIMGPFSYIPNMECNHGVVSVHHAVAGILEINKTPISFTGGDGYIEKDWGRSFPQSWIWMQCNSFTVSGSSFMFSVAKIPSFGSWFTGFLGFFHHEGAFYTFATWNKSHIQSVTFSESTLTLVITTGKVTLTVTAEQRSSGTLLAPSAGSMNRRIKESVDSTLTVRAVRKDGTVIADMSGVHAGVEIVGSIFETLKDSGIVCSEASS